jgi:transposase
MLGKRGPQRGLFEADTVYGDFVGRDTFYGFLAAQRGVLFRDEDFAALYVLDNGRPSVPPSLLATALVLQTYAGVSDEEARQRATYDLRWKVALGVEVDARPFAKSTLQEFRAQLLVHAQQRAVFERSLALAQQRGAFRASRPLKVALDTTNILGRGAVKDTYNLLADGIRQVLRVLAGQADTPLAAWATTAGYGRYVTGPSVKGAAGIDWDDRAARDRFLGELVADADRLLAEVRAAREGLVAGGPEETALVAAAGLLSRVLQQDVARPATGAALKEGTAPDRLVSIHDPEMRHGRKSAAKRFDGHKAAVVVDTDSQLITAVAVLAGNAPDHEGALALGEQTEAATGCAVAESYGDGAYGDGATRQAFAAAARVLIAKVPRGTNQGRWPKTAFRIDLGAGTCTCPGEQTTRDLRRIAGGQQGFVFAAATCAACPLRAQCVAGAGGRTVTVHPQEALLQAARTFQASPAFGEARRRRQTVEHRLARLVQLGIRQARYVGRTKTLFQVLMAAAVANLTLLARMSLDHPTAPSTGGAAVALVAAVAILLALGALHRASPEAPGRIAELAGGLTNPRLVPDRY